MINDTKFLQDTIKEADRLINKLNVKIFDIGKIANNLIYFDDNSDYKSGLWEILDMCHLACDEDELKYIE